MATNQRFTKEFGGKLLGARNYVEFFPLQETDRILDVGCGKGTELAAYWRHGSSWYSAVGIDHDAKVIEDAQRAADAIQLPHATFLVADAAHLPFPDSSFDKVLAIDLIQYVPDPQKAFGELCRVLKPGGQLLITFPAFWHVALTALSRAKARALRRTWHGGGSLSVHNWMLSRWLTLAETVPMTLVRSRASTLFPPLHRYGIPRFWFSNNLVHRVDTFFSRVPFLKRFGQALICVYRKSESL